MFFVVNHIIHTVLSKYNHQSKIHETFTHPILEKTDDEIREYREKKGKKNL